MEKIKIKSLANIEPFKSIKSFISDLKSYINYLKGVSLQDMWYYNQGMYRMLCYQKAPYLLRTHILEQYHERLVAAEECLNLGKCKMCQCSTPELFFADKPCSLSKLTLANRKTLYGTTEICYGQMLNKKQYNNFKNKKYV